ncbi:hypothetical protein [Sphingomonas metalli]|nr:hypothetical protein [Sphingomonas metalli]
MPAPDATGRTGAAARAAGDPVGALEPANANRFDSIDFSTTD